MKNKKEIKEKMALINANLPSNIEQSKIDDSIKRVLGTLIIMCNTEKNKNDGWFYMSNRDLCEKSLVSSKTIPEILCALENKFHFIQRSIGDNRNASKYVVFMDNINNYSDSDCQQCTVHGNHIEITKEIVKEITKEITKEIIKEIGKEITEIKKMISKSENCKEISETTMNRDVSCVLLNEIGIKDKDIDKEKDKDIDKDIEGKDIKSFPSNIKEKYKKEIEEIENNLNQNLKYNRLDDERPSLNQNNIEIEEKMKIEENNNKNEGGSSTTATNTNTNEEKDMIPTQAIKQENDRVGINNCQPSNNPQENKTNNTPTVEQMKSASDTHQEDLKRFNKALHIYPNGIDSLRKLEERNTKFTKWIAETFADDEALLQECLAQAEECYEVMKEKLIPTVGVIKSASDAYKEDLEQFNKALHIYPNGIDSLRKLEERNKKFIKWIKDIFGDNEALLQECLAQAEERYQFMKEKLNPTKPKEPFFTNNDVMPLPLDVLVNTIDPEKDGALLDKIVKFKDKSLLEYTRFPNATPQVIEDIHQAKLEQIKEICRSCLIFTVQPSLKEAAKQEYKKAMEQAKKREAELAQATTQPNDDV